MTRKAALVLLSVLAASALSSCGKDRADIAAPSVQDYSYARPGEVTVLHMDLDIDVDFERRVIAGSVAFDIENRANANTAHFDTWALRIREVSTEDDQGRVAEANWVLGDSLEMIGRPLSVAITPSTRRVMITYETTPGQDRGVQWLSPAQTAGKQHPYMYTQSQAIHARSWVPCPDTPADRFTYTARVRVPAGLMALMSAQNPRERSTDGAYRFEMKEPLPSYLLALAVGDIEFRAIGERTGVYSEPSMVEKAAWEFADLEKMMKTAEKMNGPYRWGRYDLLVLPPAFPFGGMENPRLSFLSPVLLAGDRSLVSTVAHELAHSWSGNLVTNETWNDLWLNEGFTTYFERRIVEQIYGREYRDMQAMLGLRDIELEFDEIGADSKDTALYVEYAGRNPDEVPTAAAYEKACLFLTMMEDSLGSDAWDRFLRGYFEAHAFKTMTTKRFVEYMKGTLFAADSTRYESLRVEQWIYEPGIPANAPKVESKRFEEVDRQIDAFARGVAAKNLKTGGWTTMEWQRFLDNLPAPLPAARLADLDETFGFSHANAVVQRSWFPAVIAAKYEPAYPAIETFLFTIGRRYLLRPVYGELAKTPEGLAFARRVFEQARPGYHAITATGIEMVLYPQGRASK